MDFAKNPKRKRGRPSAIYKTVRELYYRLGDRFSTRSARTELGRVIPVRTLEDHINKLANHRIPVIDRLDRLKISALLITRWCGDIVHFPHRFVGGWGIGSILALSGVDERV